MSKSKTNPYRLLAQLSIFLLLAFMVVRIVADRNYIADFEAQCPFGGIQAFASFIFSGSLACSMTSVQIAMGFALIIAVVLFSKLFCSFICPVGSISEWLGHLGEKWKIRRSIGGWMDKIFRFLKYILLFITVYISVTSSELFCKWFCPYFAVASGFNADVDIIMASAALLIVVFGSIFFRLFWCKYLCPVNAVSNIFRFFYVFAAVLAAYILIRFAGWQLNFLWPLALLCVLGYVLELRSLKTKTFPIFKVRRHESSCTNCNLCTKSCPQGIPVASRKVVRDADCHLCADCLHVCPEKGALTINKRGKKWLPFVATAVLIVAGIFAGKSFDLPTIQKHWADPADMREMEEYNINGLKTITCYGSSVLFSYHMYDMEGVYGVATYVDGQRVKIWYDAELTDTVKIREWIFTPATVSIREVPRTITELSIYELRVDNFLNELDATYLADILSADTTIYGLTSEFACPVKISVYLSPDSPLTTGDLQKLVEQKLRKNQIADGKKLRVDLKYKVTEISKGTETISIIDYLQLFEELPDN